MKKYLKPLAVLAIISVIFSTIYGTVQYILRMDANDPQIQMAQDAANLLNNGATITSVITPKIDTRLSLAPVVIVYDTSGHTVGTAAFAGQFPIRDIPFGVLKAAGSDYNAVTWEPESNVRLAAVAVKANQYYVVSARSLREVESRENTVFKIAAIGWLITLLTISTAYYLPKYLRAKSEA